MKIENVLYLPSGRIFLCRTENNYLIECTEMRDVAVDGKLHSEVRISTNPHTIWKHLVPWDTKWLLTVSTQKGCSHNCKFCDVAPLPFCGNLSTKEIREQIELLLLCTPYISSCRKVKIGFARMGEPAWNINNVLGVIKDLPEISRALNRNYTWLPCFNSILPSRVPNIIERVIETKEKYCNGFLHFQISCNSTDEDTRKELFGGADVLSIEDIIKQVNTFSISNRTVTLNFIVMQNIEVSVKKLKAMNLNSQKFTIKLIPLNCTNNAESHDLKTVANYNNYEKLLSLKDEFEKEGVPVVVDAIAKCEEAGLCCGQLAQIFQ